MKILHIYSGAFDYFTDIKHRVWRLVEWQQRTGWQVEVLDLRYGAPRGQETREITRTVPGTVPAGLFELGGVLAELNNFDAVHVHAPFLGVGKIWRHLKNNPEINLLVTFYESTPLSDLFSYFLRAYNGYYLAKFFSRARLIFYWRAADFVGVFGRRYLRGSCPAVDLEKTGAEIIRENIHLTTSVNQVKLTKEDGPYLACIEVYKNYFRESYGPKDAG